MGKFDGKNLKGLIGKIVVRKGKKAQIVQSAPKNIKQTKETKKAANTFGRGSAVAGVLRRELNSLFEDHYDGGMINRLTTSLAAILRQCHDPKTEEFSFQQDSFERLAGFEFNNKSSLVNSLWVKPEMTYHANLLTISIPEIKIPAQLKFPTKANVCDFNLVVSQIALDKGLDKGKAHYPLSQIIEISRSQELIPAQEFTFEIASGVLCVAGIGLNYFKLNNNIKTVINSKTFNPSGIIGALITEGTFVLPPLIKTPKGGVYGSPWRDILK